MKFMLTAVAALCLSIAMIGCESDSDMSTMNANPGAMSEKGDCGSCTATCDGAKGEASLGAVGEKDCGKCCGSCDGAKAKDASMGAVGDCPASKDCGSSCGDKAESASMGAVSDCSASKACGSACSK